MTIMGIPSVFVLSKYQLSSGGKTFTWGVNSVFSTSNLTGDCIHLIGAENSILGVIPY